MSEPSRVAGRLEIPVESDLTGFAQALKTKVEAIANSVKAKVGIEFEDTTVLRGRLEAAVKTAAKGVTAKIKTQVDVDRAQAERAARTAAQAVTRVVEREGAKVKVEADDRATRQTTSILARVKAWARAQSVEIPVTMGSPRGPTRGGPMPGMIGMALRGPMILGMLSLIQPAIALIVQSLGGLVAMAGSALSSLNTIASVAPLINALGFSFAAGLIAFTGWSEEADHTTKSMQSVRKEVEALHPQWGRLLESVREATWSKVAGEIEPVATRLLPLLDTGLSRIGATLGRVMRDGLRFMDTSRFASNLTSMLSTSDKVIRDLTRGLGGLLTWWMDLSVAAGPFTEGMAATFREFGEWTATLLDGRGERAAFREWLAYAGEKATELGRILKNVWTGFGGLFDGGRESGDRLLATLEQVTAGWSRWTNSLQGQNQMREWFGVAEEGTRAVGRLLSAVGDALLRLANDPALATIVNKITAELLPSLESFLRQLGTEVGPVVVDFISNVLELLSQLAAAGGPIAAVLSSFNELIVAFSGLLEVTPGLASALGLLLGAAIAIKPLSLIFSGIAGGVGKLAAVSGAGRFAGLVGLVGILAGLTGSAEGAHPALSTLAGTLGAMLLLGPRARTFGGQITGMFTAMRDARARARDMSALQAGLASISGSYAGIDLATGAIRRSGDASAQAAPRFRLFSTGAGALKTAAGGLMGVLGGPWGIALGAAVTGLTMWWQKNQEAKAAVESHTEAIVANAGQLSQANREMVASALMDEGAVEAAERIGVSYADLINAAMGVPEAQARVKAATDAATESYDRQSEAHRGVRGGYTLISDGAKQAADDSRKVTNAIGGQNAVVSEAVGKAEQKAAADEAAAQAARDVGENTDDAAAATAEYAAQQDDARRTVDTLREGIAQLIDTMREQREMTMTSREATREQKEGYARAREEVKTLRDELGSLDGALTKNKDAFNTNSEAGRQLESTFDGLVEDTWRALEAAKANGASQEDLNKIWQRGKDNLAGFSTEVGLTPAGLKELQAELGMTEGEFALFLQTAEETPKKVETEVEVKGAKKGKDDLDGLKIAAEANPKDVTTKVSTPGAKGSKGELDNLKSSADRLPKSKRTDVSAPGTSNSTGLVQGLKSWYDRLPGRKSTDVSAPGTSNSTGLIQFLINTANRIPRSKSTSVSASTGSAWSGLQGIINQLRNIQSKSVTVTTFHRTLQTAVANGAVFNADGGIQRFEEGGFAGGARSPFWAQKVESRIRNGFRNVEQHVAQILPAGSWRVWAEDETGGEAYIPLSPAKRLRSMAILREVAARFGMALMPAAATFSRGGMTMPSAGAPSNAAAGVPFMREAGPTYVTFEEGSIKITNPEPEPVSRSIAQTTRSITINGLFGED